MRSYELKWYENLARYLLGIIYLFGAVDGALELLCGIYITGEPGGVFLTGLYRTTYFWAFMKFIELIGAVSLLANHKPVLGLAMLMPISAVLCLFYVFELKWYIAFSVIVCLTTILLRAYHKSYLPLLDKYS
jgi:hypothetical protein